MNKKFQIYRYSPIKDQQVLFEAIEYLVGNMTLLCKKITGQEYPIECLTIFSHYSDEYENLKNIALKLGSLHSEANGPYVRLYKPLIYKNTIDLLRIRNPDPYRLHVGCGDFKVPNYDTFKQNYLVKNPNNLRIFKRPDYEMIEFFDPDFDILAYVLSKEL